MTEQTFEEFAAEVERQAIARQIEDNCVSFIEHQSLSWSSIQSWWQESHEFGPPPETANGPASTLGATKLIRDWLQGILGRYRIRTMLDAACGDWNWMCHVDLQQVEYTGWDVGQWMIDRCQERLAEVSSYEPDVIFERINLLTVPEMPAYDLILCRDFLSHLPNKLIVDILTKFKQSGSKYLLTSHYPQADNSFTYEPQDFTYFGYMERPVNLEAPPFGLSILESKAEISRPGVVGQPHDLALLALR